ncbi:hypothetical protein DYBT9275_05459 [Dyadobacter sp. CECT 9275]|uniref:Uncharacterized protein n=1 Tax=Dyadobacter helix TaxID=2822344 RepID=A0A916JK41_9BACT|nr:hypothetical protein DYBT9275_05459 [Dyadobacter sp. CECT 9275]
MTIQAEPKWINRMLIIRLWRQKQRRGIHVCGDTNDGVREDTNDGVREDTNDGRNSSSANRAFILVLTFSWIAVDGDRAFVPFHDLPPTPPQRFPKDFLNGSPHHVTSAPVEMLSINCRIFTGASSKKRATGSMR